MRPTRTGSVPIAGAAVAALLLPLVLAACGDADRSGPTARVYKYRGSVQCGDRGTSPETMASQLRAAGVTVLSVECGIDPLMRPAVCGTETGELNVFEIFERDLPRAGVASFKPLSDFAPPAFTGPATIVACPPA